jgi:hypothetical protein
VHCGLCQAFLIGSPRVRFSHFERAPTKDSHQLVPRCAVIGGNSRACLAQAVRRAMPQSRLIAPLPKFVSETGIREWPSQIVHEECEFSAWRGIDYVLQCWQDRQDQPPRLAIASLELCECNFAVPHVLAAKSSNVRPPLSRK